MKSETGYIYGILLGRRVNGEMGSVIKSRNMGSQVKNLRKSVVVPG